MNQPSGYTSQRRGEFRTGTFGALCDEFERASNDFAQRILALTDEEYVAPRVASDNQFASIQRVAQHVVQAGYGHSNHLRLAFGVEGGRVDVPLFPRTAITEQMQTVHSYLTKTLEGRWQMTDEEIEALEFSSRWGPTYHPEQMLEHAIVHILRHRRQIERLLAEE
ncbi:MAG: DinB family protein [Acidobacteriota bacterium]